MNIPFISSFSSSSSSSSFPSSYSSSSSASSSSAAAASAATADYSNAVPLLTFVFASIFFISCAEKAVSWMCTFIYSFKVV